MTESEKDDEFTFQNPVEIESFVQPNIDPSYVNYLPVESDLTLSARLQTAGSYLLTPNFSKGISTVNVLNLEPDVPDKYSKPSKYEKFTKFKKKKLVPTQSRPDDILSFYNKELQKQSSLPGIKHSALTLTSVPSLLETELIQAATVASSDSSDEVKEHFPSVDVDQLDVLGPLKPGDVKSCEPPMPLDPADEPDEPARLFHISELRYYYWKQRWRQNLVMERMLEMQRQVELEIELEYKKTRDFRDTFEKELPNLTYEEDLQMEEDDDYINECTDMQILLIKGGTFNPREYDYKFKCHQDERLIDFKVKLSATMSRSFHLITVQNLEGKVLEDSLPFTCLLSRGDPSEPKLIKLIVREQPAENDAGLVLHYNVFLIPIVLPKVYRITLKSGEEFEVEKEVDRKPFLGGYVDNVNCKVYHHSATQTTNRKDICDIYDKFEMMSRHEKFSQTRSLHNACVQTNRNTSTQMTDVGVYRSIVEDKVVVPSGTYVTADEFWQIITNNIVTVQKYFRRWYARRIIENRLAKKLCIEFEESQLLDFSFLEEEKAEQMLRRMHPKTKEDFDLLYVDLEVWRLAELAEISSKMSGAKKKAALCQLMEDESRLIKCICEMRRNIKDQRLLQIFQNYINRISKPKMKRDERGLPLSVDTWYKIQSRLLFVQYQTMDHNTTFMSGPYERLSALSNLKKCLENNDNERLIDVKLEILEMIEREATLTMRGVKKDKLMGLRRRINNLFYMLLKKPEFNPAVAEHLKNLRKPSYLQTIVCCISCEKNLPVSMFPHTTTFSALPKICKDCQRTNNRGCKRTDISLYAAMLMRLRREERDYDDGSRVAFFIQIKDIQYLVDCIWQMRSILSKNTNLSNLVLMRWDIRREWTPWNSILVTMHEALCHLRVNDVRMTYSPELIYFVEYKHVQARKEFSRLVPLACRRQLPLHKKLTNLPEVGECPAGVPKVFTVRKPHEKRSVYCKNLRML